LFLGAQRNVPQFGGIQDTKGISGKKAILKGGLRGAVEIKTNGSNWFGHQKYGFSFSLGQRTKVTRQNEGGGDRGSFSGHEAAPNLDSFSGRFSGGGVIGGKLKARSNRL